MGACGRCRDCGGCCRKPFKKVRNTNYPCADASLQADVRYWHLAEVVHRTCLLSGVADMQEGYMDDPEQHPIAIALWRQSDIDDARVSKREVMIRRGDRWFRYGAPKRVP